MREAQRTVAYVGLALVLGIVTVLARPRREEVSVAPVIGKPLFEKFTDPGKAAGLQLVRYIEDAGEVHTFEIAKNPANGLWTIPSHGNYPADAQEQMKEAASVLSDVTVLDVASENQQDHQLFGVIEPNKEKLKVGDKGVGLLVAFKDEKGDNLARVIVGKQVKNSPDKRFLRIPGQDPVYVAKINIDKLSTKFEDWIEKDLLKINAFDVERLRLKDYSVVPVNSGNYGIQPRSEITTSFHTADGKWTLDEMITYKNSEAVKSDLLPGEELNKEKLDALKNALDQVQIADVYRKPKGLGATLKATGDFAKDVEARRSLQSRGFILGSEEGELLAANGELHALTKDGVEYVLRFGNVAGEQEDSAEGKLNRYLFVTARVDMSKIPYPTLADVPGGTPPIKPSSEDAPPATEKPATEKPATEKPATEKPATEKPAEAAKDPSEGEKPAEPAAPAKPDEKPAAAADATPEPGSCGQEEAKAEEAKAEEAKSEKPKSEEPKDAAKADAANAAEQDKPAEPAVTAPAKPAAAAPAGATPAADGKSADEDLAKKKLDADRERITKENQRKIDDYEDKKKMAEQTVRELNSRFADWYYVISEDTYKKLHLSRSDIIKESEKAAEEGTGLDAFRQLEKRGLKKGESKKPEGVPTFPPMP